jgi:hypothetical protein
MTKELRFKHFFRESKHDEKDIKRTISKLPKSHQKVIDGIKIKYTCKNTLDFDKNHVGQIKDDKITVSAPWNYSRQFTTLHEIAHIVWCKILSDKQKKEWAKIAKKKNLKEKDTEELFCMAYANYYSKHKLLIYNNSEWASFIKSIK